MFADILQLIFPAHCPSCGNKLTKQEKGICWPCLTDIEETGFHQQPTENELWFRLAGRVPLHWASAHYYFDKKGKLKRIIQALKYHNQPRLGIYLGEYYGAHLQGNPALEPFDCLVPVPVHTRKKAQRGYNQAYMIAKGLSAPLSLPVLENHLVRSQKGPSQTKKGKMERWENVKDSFDLKRPLPKNLLLVDDIITTGSTLEACIRVIMTQERPPEKIGILAIGMTRKN